jgi:hypothetical protein
VLQKSLYAWDPHLAPWCLYISRTERARAMKIFHNCTFMTRASVESFIKVPCTMLEIDFGGGGGKVLTKKMEFIYNIISSLFQLYSTIESYVLILISTISILE